MLNHIGLVCNKGQRCVRAQLSVFEGKFNRKPAPEPDLQVFPRHKHTLKTAAAAHADITLDLIQHCLEYDFPPKKTEKTKH